MGFITTLASVIEREPCNLRPQKRGCFLPESSHVAEPSPGAFAARLYICFPLTLFFSLTRYIMPYPYARRPPRVCTLSFFTIKVLTRLFQVCRLHKSFPFSLLHPIALISLRKRRVCLQGINPQTTAAPLLLVLSFLPLLLFLLVQLSHPTFIVSDQMSASIQVATQRLHSTAGSLIFFFSQAAAQRSVALRIIVVVKSFFLFFFFL